MALLLLLMVMVEQSEDKLVVRENEAVQEDESFGELMALLLLLMVMVESVMVTVE